MLQFFVPFLPWYCWCNHLDLGIIVSYEKQVTKGKRNQANRKVWGTSPGTEGNLLLLILEAKWHIQKEKLVYYHLPPANHLFV